MKTTDTAPRLRPLQHANLPPAKGPRCTSAPTRTPLSALLGALLGAALTLGGCGDDPDASSDASADTGADASADTVADTTPDTAGDATDTTPDTYLPIDEVFQRVDGFIGTGGAGFNYASLSPAAQLPTGFVKVGPDTTTMGAHPTYNHFSGYFYGDPQVRGFSHTRLIGTGATDLGNLRFLPLAELNEREPWHRFTALDKDSEEFVPGRYSVHLPDEGVSASVSATGFAAIHTYDFEGGAYLQIDAGSAITDSGTREAHVSVEGTTLTGYVEHGGGFTGRSRPFTLYFDIDFNVAPIAVSVWDAEGVREGTTATGERGGTVLQFPEGTLLEARVGLSLIDADAARANRLAELGDKSLEDIAEDAALAWTQVLDNVRIEGGTEREQRMFYTALYNAYRMPSNLSESDGRFAGFDGRAHQAEGFRYHTDLSLWDTYRTLHPWYSLTDHDLQRDCLHSLLTMAEQGERGVPNWPSMLSYTGSMIGTSSDIVFGDAAAKGVTGVDWEEAYHTLYDSAYGRTQTPPLNTGREGIEDYLAYGYLPADQYGESVSKTLEYSWDDFGLAAVARAAGLTQEAQALEENARSFLNLFRPEDGFMWPRNADGSWDPTQRQTEMAMRSGNFTEGTPWHWRWYGWHDADAFAGAYETHGLDLNEALESFMTRSGLGSPGRPNLLTPDKFYWHGNEPSLHATSVFHLAGEPDRASYWIREAQERVYDDTPAGLAGNDDGGTLSTWYLFAALGLYPLAGSDLYYLHAPLFERAQVTLGGGGTLTIEAPGAGRDTYAITEILLNGEPLEARELRHAELYNATLHFTLSPSADD